MRHSSFISSIDLAVSKESVEGSEHASQLRLQPSRLNDQRACLLLQNSEQPFEMGFTLAASLSPAVAAGQIVQRITLPQASVAVHACTKEHNPPFCRLLPVMPS